MSIYVFVSLSAVNGISFSSAFSFIAKKKKNAFRSACSIYTSQKIIGLGLEMQSLGLDLEQ